MPGAPRDLVPTVQEWVAETVAQAYPDDGVTWGVSLQMLPDPTQDEAWLPILALYIELPVVGHDSFYVVLMLPPFQVERDQIRTELQAALGSLNAQRDAFHAAANKES